MVKNTRNKMTLIDLFAGCGGLSLGLERANFIPVFVNELNHHAMETYLANRDHELGGLKFSENQDLHCNDIKSLGKKRLEKLRSDIQSLGIGINFDKNGYSSLDLIAGGPPCQGYSGIGHRRSYSVDKKELPSNQLYKEMARVIRSLKPRMFLFENVKGLMSSRWTKDGEKGEIWKHVWKHYSDLGKKEGYTVRYSLVLAKDYGVPQNRPRILMVGIRNDIVSSSSILEPSNDKEDAIKCNFLPEGKPGGYPQVIDVLDDLIDTRVSRILETREFPSKKFETTHYRRNAKKGTVQEYYRRKKHGNKILSLGERLTEQEYSRHSEKIVRKFQYMIDNDSEIPIEMKTKKFAQRVLPKMWNGKGPSITTTSLPDDYVHYSQPRSLTVREWARFQMFPDWYVFKGKRTTGGIRRAGNPREGIHDREVPKYTQIGNAVPVELARRVGEHFKKILQEVT